MIYQKLKQYENALESFNRALYLNPKYIEALVNKGTLLVLMDINEEAIDNFDKALSLDPFRIQALNNKAMALRNL